VHVGDVLLHILVVLVAAKVAAEVAERVGLPSVVGEILAGIAIGPSVLGLVGSDEVLRTLGELGVILLLLEVGLEMDIAELGAVGKASLLVAVAGVVVPFATGFGVALGFGEPAETALFLGAALTATSVGITARVFGDMRALTSVEARTVLGAAVADDVIGLVILTVVVRVVAEGTVSVVSVLGLVGLAVGFLVVTTGVGLRLAPALFGFVQRVSRSPGTLVALALAFTLAVAQLADAAQLAPIVGAFVAGLALARSDQAERIRRELAPVGHLFVPVFFLQIGIDADLAAMTRPSVLGLAAALLAVAVVGKIVAGWAAVGSPGDRLTMGLGMLPRGEVGLIFAGIGLRQGVLGDDLYGALLLVILATTLVTPSVLALRFRRVQANRRHVTGARAMPAGGWLRVEDGVVDLAAEPPDHEALHVGLQAAVAAADARPGPALLDWLAAVADVPLRWDRAGTGLLFTVLRKGNARSWRLLEATGLLERALPELAASLARRRSDPFELDPARMLRWSLVEDVRGPAEAHPDLRHPEWLLLAALVLEASGDGDGVAAVRTLAKRLDLGAEAEEEVALLVGQSGLLRAAAARPDGLSEERVVQIATHLETKERATALYLLSVALGALDPADRHRLDSLYEVVCDLLDRPELTARDARNVAEQRRAVATRLAVSPAVAERLAHTSRAWLLSQEPSALARQARLVEPLPPKGVVRVAVVPEEPSTWRIDIACRDRPALLAVVTGVLARHGFDVEDAGATTWPDGAAVETFVVRAPAEPDAEVLQTDIEAALSTGPASEPVPDAAVSFDDEASPWYTLCQVEAPDRPGLLHALASAFAACGADVHSVRASTVGGRAIDRFELTDGRGHKLHPRTEAAIAAAVAVGVRPRRRGRTKPTRRRNKQGTDQKPPLSRVTGNTAEFVPVPDGGGNGATRDALRRSDGRSRDPARTDEHGHSGG
jgi:Kef-type K+ transport system membrane component KefB/predicted amino acid-binding ACT domain protein